MDVGFKGYVVMKAISLIEGRWEKAWKLMSPEDAEKHNMGSHVEDLDHINLWRAFYTIPTEEMEKIICELMQKRMLYSDTVQVRDAQSSMLFITSKGKKILNILDNKYYPILNEYISSDNRGSNIIKERSNHTYMFSGCRLSQVF